MVENKNADISAGGHKVAEERQIRKIGEKYKNYYEQMLKKSRV